jgi:WD40 repeat protein
VRLWKDDGTPVRQFAGLGDYVYALAVSQDAALVAAGAYDGEVRVWKLADGAVVKSFNASPGYIARTRGK